MSVVFDYRTNLELLVLAGGRSNDGTILSDLWVSGDGGGMAKSGINIIIFVL